VFEPLRAGYRWASDRIHRFILDGMADNRAALRDAPVRYFPYVERHPGEGKGLLQALAGCACVVVTDDYPGFFLPHMIEAAGAMLDVRLEAVDANGLLPMRATRRVFTTAFSFRSYLAKNLHAHLEHFPRKDPLSQKLAAPGRLPSALTKRWPLAPGRLLDGSDDALAALEIDHEVRPVEFRGGSLAAHERLRYFVRKVLPDYAKTHSVMEVDGTSKLSPWLHFGHVGPHEIVEAIVRREKTSRALQPKENFKQGALFGLSEGAEALLEELIVWRELGLNMTSKREDAARFESLPEWAKKTLGEHRKDRRPRLQTPEALEQGRTDDPMFNAAQRQLLEEGWFHNVARMLWGKKLLEYTESPEQALETMAELMNRYSLDGRDPNSTTGFFWVLGRYDRAWGPERPIFGKVRFMTSDTPDKLRRYRKYIARYAP
jgi:deoxyribodipyrimidine photo-lyase